MKSIFTHTKIILTQATLLPVVFSLFAFPVLTQADTASIQNSVSVSSNGDGSAYASIKTIVNGETVDDQVLYESGTLSSSTTVSGATTTVSTHTTIEEAQSRDAQLLILIEKLKLLIQYYVSLLNTK